MKLYNDGLFISTEEIGIIKNRLGLEPWKSAFNLLKTEAENALNATEMYFSDHKYNCPGEPATCADYANGKQIRNKIRSLGMYYALTGKEEYANKVVSWIKKLLLNSTTRIDPNIIHHYTYASIICGILYGAQLTLKSSKWDSIASPTPRTVFKAWCNSTGNTYKNFLMKGDFAYSKEYMVIICGILSDNSTLISSQIDDFKIRIKADVDKDGSLIGQRGRQGSGGCTIGCPQNGNSTDFCCGLSYNGLGTRHIITIVELMRHRNINLYTQSLLINVGRTVTIEKMLDFNAIFYNKPSSWYLDTSAIRRDYKYCSKKMSCFIGQSRDIFEFGYSLFKKVSYKDAIIRWGRGGLYDERVMGYVTLTHGSKFI